MNPWIDLPQIDWGTRETPGMFLAWFWDSKLSLFLLEKIAKIVIYDKTRVNGGTNYNDSGLMLGYQASLIYRYLFGD